MHCASYRTANRSTGGVLQVVQERAHGCPPATTSGGATCQQVLLKRAIGTTPPILATFLLGTCSLKEQNEVESIYKMAYYSRVYKIT